MSLESWSGRAGPRTPSSELRAKERVTGSRRGMPGPRGSGRRRPPPRVAGREERLALAEPMRPRRVAGGGHRAGPPDHPGAESLRGWPEARPRMGRGGARLVGAGKAAPPCSRHLPLSPPRHTPAGTGRLQVSGSGAGSQPRGPTPFLSRVAHCRGGAAGRF